MQMRGAIKRRRRKKNVAIYKPMLTPMPIVNCPIKRKLFQDDTVIIGSDIGTRLNLGLSDIPTTLSAKRRR